MTASAALTDLAALTQWLGRKEEASEIITPEKVNALAATLDWDAPPFKAGMPLPPAWHWIFCCPALPTHQLGRDGHPQKGGFLPPVALPRRMWAGGRLEFLAPLRVGQTVRRVSTIDDIQAKTGKSGPLVFVTVRHEMIHGDTLCVRETQDLVYRQDPDPNQPAPPPPQAPAKARWQKAVETGSILLFRYSALTFNGHRIHYDVDYCRRIEGYSGLVVHGPLLATWLANFAAGLDPRPLQQFRFRGRSPATCDPLSPAPLTLCADHSADENTLNLWVRTADGLWITEATAIF